MLTALGLIGQRATLQFTAPDTSRLTHLDTSLVALTLIVAIGATFLAGLYPAWRAARTPIGWQLKEQ
jgi:putative ABC transport system permease protein